MSRRLLMSAVLASSLAVQAATAHAQDVSVARMRDGVSKPCAALVETADRGCWKFIMGPKLDFTVETLAGELPFAHCFLNYNLQVDSEGRTMMSTIIVAGENPCNDVGPCRDAKEEEMLPWRGRIVRRPRVGLVHEVDACFRTCLGRFEAPLTLRLREGPRAWRATSGRTAIGTTGLVLSGGRWDWDVPGLELRARAGASP